MLKQNLYRTKTDVVLKNKLTNESVRGNIINEREIEGKQYWVMQTPSRGTAQLSYNKDSWLLTKGK